VAERRKSVGIIERKKVSYVAEPFGVIAAATPTTNPTSTVEFKSLIALKSRNVVIFAFHPRAQKCSAEAAKIMLEAAVSGGAPANCIQWIDEPSIEATNLLMKHPGVNLILATGYGQVRIQFRSPRHRRRSGQYPRLHFKNRQTERCGEQCYCFQDL
jgi:acyl-CoA reductase-like NAD-dependent aldehyde dehydrogenase